MRILLVEDNHRLSDSLRATLIEDGYAVDAAYDGLEGEEMALLTPYDVIVLDIMLPKRDGIEVCRSLRDQKNTTPILMLTARDALADRVLGLFKGDLHLAHVPVKGPDFLEPVDVPGGAFVKA